MDALPPEQVAQANKALTAIQQELSKLFIGQEDLVRQVLVALMANGHVLVESVPGLGKTLLVKAIGRILGLGTNRIQFTPDLMPSDITGSHVFDMAERKFIFREGPVFTQFLLADEFNRAPAKTHSALLEVMQERQVTLDGTSHQMEAPFLVLATQNPIENEGTYNLPEAQLDRFIFKLVLDYPTEAEEERILSLFLAGRSPEQILQSEVRPLLDPANFIKLQQLATLVAVQQPVVHYINRIVRGTRGYPGLYLGSSPRAGIALLTGARALALLRGRGFVVPDDVADIALPAMRHRVILSPEAEVEGKTTDGILQDILSSIEVPRGIDVHAGTAATAAEPGPDQGDVLDVDRG